MLMQLSTANSQNFEPHVADLEVQSFLLLFLEQYQIFMNLVMKMAMMMLTMTQWTVANHSSGWCLKRVQTRGAALCKHFMCFVFFCEHLTGFFGKHLMCFSRHVSYANILRVSQKKLFKHFMYSSSHFFYLGYMKSRNEYFLNIFSLWCQEIRPSLISRKHTMRCINGNTDGRIN